MPVMVSLSFRVCTSRSSSASWTRTRALVVERVRNRNSEFVHELVNFRGYARPVIVSRGVVSEPPDNIPRTRIEAVVIPRAETHNLSPPFRINWRGTLSECLSRGKGQHQRRQDNYSHRTTSP